MQAALLGALERRSLGRVGGTRSIDLLQRAGGSVRAAAREGKMDRSHLTELLRRHGIA